ncbi:hypothetical protein OEZ85_004124 [Tetradesmus obliquus]|uniref:O-fucosyltransferase family protein n=1 Tax=Tetradesmus obliquus TaxID=3088 RepID=A0ABY8UDF2_TETOB|nr:hypothetical protein OEZ85_004124 [Tetradesmus obliquus]
MAERVAGQLIRSLLVCCVLVSAASVVHGHWLTAIRGSSSSSRGSSSRGGSSRGGSWRRLAAQQQQTTEYGCPKFAIFEDPWVKANVALTYGLKIRDGLGSQTARMLGVYAIAHASGLQYHHSPFECIGHIGGAPHYRDARCDNLPESDLHKMRRIAKHIRLPSSSAVNASAWEQQYLFRADWDKLASVAAAALQAKQPTLVGLELTDEFISPCPDIFYHVPAWRPQKYLASQWATYNSSRPEQSWLLARARSFRIVVHMRRGDLSTASAAREMPASYYINVVKGLAQVLQQLQVDFTVEWFTEPSTNEKEHEDMQRVRQEIPNLTLLFDSDLLWTWQQMWSADAFIMSKSGYSFVPAVVNTKGIVIHAPALGIRKCKIACSPSHWFEPADESGALPEELVAAVRQKVGGSYVQQ